MKSEKGKGDPRGGHVRLYWAILDSPAWRLLTHADVRIYLALRRKLGRTNNGDINATLGEMKHAGITSSSTLAAALRRLEALGFIEKTRQGGIANGGKLCSLYRFTDEPTLQIAKAGVKAGPATNEWQRFKSMAEARAVLR
jgi:predicted transcriptional regulator